MNTTHTSTYYYFSLNSARTFSKQKLCSFIFTLFILVSSIQNGKSATRFFEGGDWHDVLSWRVFLMPLSDDDGTCPILINTNANLINLLNSRLFTGVDIFNGNCSTAVLNNISNQGQIISSCASIGNFNCPLNYTGVNAITGTLLAQQTFESDGPIEAKDVLILQGPHVFDSGTSITILENFEISLNTVFEAFIDGCGGI